jgi:hypothetical protein
MAIIALQRPRRHEAQSTPEDNALAKANPGVAARIQRDMAAYRASNEPTSEEAYQKLVAKQALYSKLGMPCVRQSGALQLQSVVHWLTRQSIGVLNSQKRRRWWRQQSDRFRAKGLGIEQSLQRA